MNVIFAGTPEFAAVCLSGLLKSSHCVKAVLTQPDRQAGRGRKPQASAVKKVAQQHELPILQFESVLDANAKDTLSRLEADLMVVVAYGLLLPNSILTLFPNGCVNVHASLLPRWRGAAPIQRAIEAGDQETGISIMQMTQGLDEGPVLLTARHPLTEQSTALSTHDALANLGEDALIQCLDRYEKLTATPQDHDHATYAHKIRPASVRLDFTDSSFNTARKVRAFSGMPSCWFMLNGDRYKVHSAKSSEHRMRQGQVDALKGQLCIGCSEGALEIEVLQPPGKKPMGIRDFLNGNPVLPECVDIA